MVSHVALENQLEDLPFLFSTLNLYHPLNNFLKFHKLWQGVDHFKKIKYSDGITYGELFLENEYFITLTAVFWIVFDFIFSVMK